MEHTKSLCAQLQRRGSSVALTLLLLHANGLYKEVSKLDFA